MATAEELIAWHRDGHPGMVEVARVITTNEDSKDKDDIVLEILLLEAGARGDDVTMTQMAAVADENEMVMQDHIFLNHEKMTLFALAWLARQGYTVTPPATARGSE